MHGQNQTLWLNSSSFWGDLMLNLATLGPVWLISLSNVVLVFLIYVWIKKCVEMCKRMFKM